MLSLVNIGKAESKSIASATNDFFMQAKSKDWRKFIIDYQQSPSKRVSNMVWRMTLRYISMGLLMKLRRFRPSLHHRFKKMVADI